MRKRLTTTGLNDLKATSRFGIDGLYRLSADSDSLQPTSRCAEPDATLLPSSTYIRAGWPTGHFDIEKKRLEAADAMVLCQYAQRLRERS